MQLKDERIYTMALCSLWCMSGRLLKPDCTEQVAYRMRMLGFNAIRLAFSFDNTWGLGQPPLSWTGACPVPTDSKIEATLVPGTDAATTVKSNGDTVHVPFMHCLVP